MRFALVAFRKIISVRLGEAAVVACDRGAARGSTNCETIVGVYRLRFCCFSCVVGYSYRGLIRD